MPRRSPPPPRPDLRDAEIRHLRDQLDLAHDTIIGLMPDGIQGLLGSFYMVESDEDFHAWMRWTQASLLALADKRPGPTMGGVVGEWRARCPLCGGGASSPGLEGFSLPTGLERHLGGTHGSRMCLVFSAAHQQAIQSMRRALSGTGPSFSAMPRRSPKPWERPAAAPLPEPPKASAVILSLRPDGVRPAES